METSTAAAEVTVLRIDAIRVDAPEETQTVMRPRPRARGSRPLWIIASLALIGAAQYARELLIPIIFAILLAFLLRPMLRRLKRYNVPNMASAFLLIGGVVALFVGGIWSLAGQAQEWLAHAPETIRRVSQMAPAGSGPLLDFAKTQKAIDQITKPNGEQQPFAVQVQSTDTMLTALGVSSHFFAASVIVFVLAYFLLAFSDSLLKQAVESRISFNEKRNVVQLIQNIERGISKYLYTITIINIGLGVVTSFLMWGLGIPNPVLWGVMATTLNYIPHIGAFLCMVVVFFVGAVSHESLGFGLLATGCFALLTTLESYFVTPMVLSRSLQLSPLAVILAILFMVWLWGVSGGLMAAPLLAVFKIVCDQFESMHWLGAFLAGESEMQAA